MKDDAPQPRRFGRARRVALLVAAAAVMVGALAAVGSRSADDGSTSVVATPRDGEATPPIAEEAEAPTLTTESAPSTTAAVQASATIATAEEAPATTLRGAPTTRGKGARGAPSYTAGTGPGIWAVGEDGAIRRVAEPGPFSVVQDTIFVAHGLVVSSVPVAGGPLTKRYELKRDDYTYSGADMSRLRIVRIDASPSGAAVLRVAAPLSQGNGEVGDAFLHSPNGERLANAGTSQAWSPDGSILALSRSWEKTVRGIRADASPAWGPWPAEARAELKWSRDGGALYYLAAGGAGFERLTVADGARTQVPGFQGHLDPGPDGRIVGSYVTGNADSCYPCNAIYNPADGQATPLNSKGLVPRWSPNGVRFVVLDEPHATDARRFASARIIDGSGATKATVTAASGTSVGGAWSRGPAWPSPQWSTAGTLVVVISTGATP